MDRDEFFMYVLLTSGKKLYCGWTNDVKKRFKAHCCGKGAKFTKINRPIKILYYEKYPSKSFAMKAESRFKKLRRNENRIYEKSLRQKMLFRF